MQLTFRSANCSTQHTRHTTNMAVAGPYPKMVIRDRSLNRWTSDYMHAQITYIKTFAFPHFLRSIHFFPVVMLQTPFFGDLR